MNDSNSGGVGQDRVGRPLIFHVDEALDSDKKCSGRLATVAIVTENATDILISSVTLRAGAQCDITQVEGNLRWP